MKRTLRTLACLALCLIFACCSALAQTTTITDQAGREVILEIPAQRIVSCYYISTASLLALGAEDQLVGIEMKADSRRLYQLAAPQIIDLPAVGSGKGVNVEEIASIQPDVVILPVKLVAEAESLELLGIPVVIVDPETLEGYRECVRLLGEIAGTEAQASALLGYYDEKYAEISALTADVEHPLVYMSSGAGYLRTYPSGMYQHALIEAAGGINVAGDLEGATQADISAEQLVAWNPQYMFIVADADYTPKDVLEDSQLSTLDAVKNENIYEFPSDIEAWDYPTPSSILGLMYLTHILHPDLYTAEQYQSEAESFYRDFFGIEVSADDIGL